MYWVSVKRRLPKATHNLPLQKHYIIEESYSKAEISIGR
jgi:hypothetical protein